MIWKRQGEPAGVTYWADAEVDDEPGAARVSEKPQIQSESSALAPAGPIECAKGAVDLAEAE